MSSDTFEAWQRSGLVSFVMTRKMLLGIRNRAEHAAASQH